MKILNPILFLTALLLLGCSSPKKHFEKGRYSKAMSGAVSEIKKGNKDKQMYTIISKSSNEIVKAALAKNESLEFSEEVKKWIKVSNRYYSLLEKIGEANKVTEGHITDTYDKLCSSKKQLDYKIVDHYYNEGSQLVNESAETGEKQLARSGHDSFKKCRKYGGDDQYKDIDDWLLEAEGLGVVYFVSKNMRPSKQFWFRPLPTDAEFVPDCSINASYGFVNTNATRSENTETITRRVTRGYNSETDTSGVVTQTPIYVDIEAKVITATITVVLRTTTNIYVENITGQCTVSSKSFTTKVSDQYEEVNVTGDLTALRTPITPKFGEPPLFRSGLEDDLLDKVDSKIGF